MLLPISLIFAGILLGILLRRTAIPGIAGRIFTPVVVLLLFAMGCAIGRNRTVMDNLPRLGLDAFILATASVAGSVIAVLLISRYLAFSAAALIWLRTSRRPILPAWRSSASSWCAWGYL